MEELIKELITVCKEIRDAMRERNDMIRKGYVNQDKGLEVARDLLEKIPLILPGTKNVKEGVPR